MENPVSFARFLFPMVKYASAARLVTFFHSGSAENCPRGMKRKVQAALGTGAYVIIC